MLTVVSGCPRSGTSLCMNILKNSLKNVKVLGQEFPQEEKLKSLLKKQKDDTEEKYSLYKYSLEKSNTLNEFEEILKHSKKMNPNGFWEDGRFTVKGLHYSNTTRSLVKEIRKNKDKEYLAKIVSQGLLNTDVELIDDIIFMIRNPYEVAKSQEDLLIKSKIIFQDKKINLFDSDIKVYSPQMFINVTYEAAIFFEENKDMNVVIIDYEDLLKSPKETLNKIQKNINKGDFSKSHQIIDPSLYRSKNYNKKEDIWKEAEEIYHLFKEYKFKEIINRIENSNNVKKLNQSWICFRTNAHTNRTLCENCIRNEKFKQSLKEQAEKDGIDWKNEPCAFECGYDVDREKYISIEDSIKNNHWKF